MTDLPRAVRASATTLCLILSSCSADPAAEMLAKCWSAKPLRDSPQTFEVTLEGIAVVDRMHGGAFLAIRSSLCPDHRLFVRSYGSMGESQLEPIWKDAETAEGFGIGIRGQARIQVLSDVREGGLSVLLLEFSTLERLSRERTEALAKTI